MNLMLICIDAGHGKNTPGKRCDKSVDPKQTREWVLNSRIADKLQDRLSLYECDVMRVDDPSGEADIPLADRVKKANRAGAGVYVSIHHNAGPADKPKPGSWSGIVAYIGTNHQKKTESVQKAIYDNLIQATGLRGNRSNGLAEANFYVLAKTNMPAVLVEHGYMDSAKDTKIILTDEFADNAATGLCHGLVEAFSIRRRQTKGAETVYTNRDGIHDFAVPVGSFELVLVDKPKKSIGRNEANAGFFGANSKTGVTVPAGHFIGKMEATDSRTISALRSGGADIANGRIVYKSVCTGSSPVTTLSVYNGAARMDERWGVHHQDYAIAGIPVIRNGRALRADEVFAQGWDRSSCRPTTHIFYGLKNDGCIHMLVTNTKTGNFIESGELSNTLLRLGYTDVIKLDGGGSVEVHSDVIDISTGGNRRICTSCRFPRTVKGAKPQPPTDSTANAQNGEDAPLMPDLFAEAVECGICDGTRPRDYGTREEMAVMVLNGIKRLNKTK